MIVGKTGYGKALYELATDENIADTVEKEFAKVAKAFKENPGFPKLLSNPALPVDERIKIVDDVFSGAVCKYLLSLIKILISAGKAALIPECYNEYRQSYYDDRNLLPVTVYSAVSLSDDQKQALSKKLEAITKKNVILNCVTDSSFIGGVRIEYKGYRIDSTIKGNLERLQRDLKKMDFSLLGEDK